VGVQPCFVQLACFEVLTAVVMRSTFWDVTPRSLLKVDQCFEENIISIFRVKEYDKQETSMKQAAIRAPLKCLLTFNRLYNILSQKDKTLPY
jgi:hypothetical protein